MLFNLFLLSRPLKKNKQTNKNKNKNKNKNGKKMTSCSVLIKLKNDVLLNVVTLRNTSYFPRFAASTSIFACTKAEKKNGALITTHSTNSVF